MSSPPSTEERADSPRAVLLHKSLHEDPLAEQTYDWALLRRLWPFVRPHAWVLAGAFALMPIAALAALLQPFLIKQAIDAALLSGGKSRLLHVALLFLGSILVEFAARFCQAFFTQLAGQRTVAGVRRAIFSHIQRLSLSFFDKTPVGRIVTRVTNDIDNLGELFASGAATALADVLMLLGIVGFMLYLDARLSLIAFLALPPLAALVEVFRRYARAAFRLIRAYVAQLTAYLAEQVEGVHIVQAFGRQADCAAEFRELNADYKHANYRAIRYDALLFSVVESVAVASVALVLWYASVRASLISDPSAAAKYVGTVVAFYEYIQRFFVPIRDLSMKYSVIQSSLASAERVFGMLDTHDFDAPPSSNRPAETKADLEPVADIVFDHVSFGYREGQDTLKDISFSVPRGAKIAVVGATGAGKTTLTALLLRLYDSREGRIRVLGHDLRGLRRDELRRMFSVVPQDVYLFAGTVFDNIALGDADADETRVVEALRRVGALDMVEKRPGGLRTQVTERGSNFSLGERQLLALARALYRDAPILILDEATASVDSRSEVLIQHAVDELLVSRTAILIAHRLSTIRRADRILVFQHGRIVEEGRHGELIRLGGVYARLCQLQFATH